MRRLAIGVLLLAAASCSGGGGDSLPECSTGHDEDGSTSVLRLHQEGDRFSGTYDVTTPDAPADTALRYTVEGTAENGKIDSTWTLGSTVVKATGTYTSEAIDLDGDFGTTHFQAGCDPNAQRSSAAATTTTARGYDPTKPTNATTSPQAATYDKVVSDLRRHGFEVKEGKSERDPLVPKLRLWNVKIEGVDAYIAVAGTDEALTTKLDTLNGFGSIAVFSTTGRWIINPESAMTDDATFAKSEKLANAIGKALYDDWQGTVRVSVP
jgi:hypothetical protein